MNIQEKLADVVRQFEGSRVALVNPESGKFHWDHYEVTRKISQAAINFGGYIVTGTRHYCPIMRMQIDAIGHDHLIKFADGHENIVQGFTDQWGFFLNREEAYVIAEAAGQLLPRHEWGNELFSESYI